MSKLVGVLPADPDDETLIFTIKRRDLDTIVEMANLAMAAIAMLPHPLRESDSIQRKYRRIEEFSLGLGADA